MGIERVRGQSTDHPKESQLPEMEDSFSWETASHKQSNGSGSLVMQALKVLEDGLVVFVQNPYLRLA